MLYNLELISYIEENGKIDDEAWESVELHNLEIDDALMVQGLFLSHCGYKSVRNVCKMWIAKGE